MIERLQRLVAVVFQGVVYAVITPVAAATIGALVAAACRPERVLLGASIGVVVGALLVVAGLSTVFSSPMGLTGFIGWWVREIPVPLVAAGVAVWSYFPIVSLALGKTVFGLRLNSTQASVAGGLAALFVVFPIALCLARILTSRETQEFLTSRILRGGLQPFQETLRRAKSIGGHRPFGPPEGEE